MNSFDVMSVESMQWNRTGHGSFAGQCPVMDTEPSQIAPEILAEVQAAIEAEVKRRKEEP